MREPAALAKSISALVVLSIIVIGWGPFAAAALLQPYTEKPFLLIMLAFPLLAAGLLYESAERLLGKGRGLYAIAILGSLPATGLAATDLSYISSCALLLIMAGAAACAVRAQGEERPAFLLSLGVILLTAGFFFRWQAGSLAFAFAVMLTMNQTSRGFKAAVILLLCYVAGAVLGQFLPLPMPSSELVNNSARIPTLLSLVALLPWLFIVFPALTSLFKTKPANWQWPNTAAVVMAVTLIVSVFIETNHILLAAGLAPLIALLGTDFAYRDFNADKPRAANFLAIPAWGTAAAFVLLPVLSTSGILDIPTLTHLHTIAAIAIAAVLVFTQMAAKPRWTFIALFFAGVLAGRLCDWHEPLFPDPDNVRAVVSLPFALAVIAAATALSIPAWLFMRKHGAHVRREPDNEFLFAEENLRRFDESADGIPVALKDTLHPPYSFVLFGDVTGAESPLSTSRGGYFMFRTLTKILKESPPAFAISLGDLARDARDSSYGHVRKLASRILVPFTVTPGNHDLFVGEKFDAACFHSLFGADNAVFDYDPARFIILNNARGFVHPQQWEWLEKVFTLPPRKFTFVFCHKPVFELRPDVFYAMETREDAVRLHDLFSARGVTAVFSGHIHSLLHERRDDVAYVISGGGGSKLTSSNDRHHYLTVDVDEEEVIVRALPLTLHRETAALLLELRLRPRT